MSFSNELQVLKHKIQKAEDDLAAYLATSTYDPTEGKKLIDRLGAAREEFICRLAAAGPEITDSGKWFTPSEFRHFASRILDGYMKNT